MSSLLEVSQAVLSGGPLLSRFTAAVWAAATTIVTEDGATPQHAARIDWAKRALLLDKAQTYASIVMRLAFSENATLRALLPLQDNGAGIADADIQASVAAYVPKFVAAGV